MGKRLSAIVTRTGDQGTTGLGNGVRVPKNSGRICAIGEIDELNSFIGLLLCELANYPESAQFLSSIQNQLFNFGGQLIVPQKEIFQEATLTLLEKEIETINPTLPHLQEFILPAGTKAACLAHVCRTICRRAERTIVALNQLEDINPLLLKYINRLSDYFFILSRSLNRAENGKEIYWQSEKLRTNSQR